MIINIQTGSQTLRIDHSDPLDVSIPLRFDGPQPNAFGVERASSMPCKAGSLIGDTRRGGSCNFEQVKLIPHCNGTHTECVGHITHARIAVRDCLREAFIPAVLVSIVPEPAAATTETYAVRLEPGDPLITRRALESALGDCESKIFDFKSGTPESAIPSPRSLIVRTLPNDEGKLTRTYLDEIPPFFSSEAMALISELAISHLLVDLPSIDRLFDEGKLANHRIFWNVRPGALETDLRTRVHNTITELIYVPDKIEDGNYLLNLQIAPFAADASPSRPVLFRLIE